jgi:hypothetical protein
MCKALSHICANDLITFALVVNCRRVQLESFSHEFERPTCPPHVGKGLLRKIANTDTQVFTIEVTRDRQVGSSLSPSPLILVEMSLKVNTFR